MDKKKIIILLIILGAITLGYFLSIISGISGSVIECVNNSVNLTQ